MSFQQLNLDPNINKAITACGYSKPTPIQEQSIPDILNGKDLMASAQTGTGKTAAFVLPALHRLSKQKPSKKTRILILTPTRELASQITKAAGLYGKFLRFNIVNLVGGMPYHHQIKDLARGADIIVATPGRLMDHMEQKRVDLSNVEMLVLDEADRMLDMGFIDDVQYIAKLTPADRQTLLFSATLDSKLMKVVRHLMKNPVRIDLSNEKIAAPLIKQEMYKVNSTQQKARLLKHFLNDENIYKAIIFSATKSNADKLAVQLRDQGFSAAALHGDLKQNVRNRTLDQLRKGKIQFLVATDVAARGIDVSDITHVFNYDLPKFCEDYVHRIGRTGRAGKTGTAISFVLPTDSRILQRIERYIGQRINLISNVEMNDAVKSNEILSLRKEPHTPHESREKFAPNRERNERRDDRRGDDRRAERRGDDRRVERRVDERRGDDRRDERRVNERRGDDRQDERRVNERRGDDRQDKPNRFDRTKNNKDRDFGDFRRERNKPKFPAHKNSHTKDDNHERKAAPKDSDHPFNKRSAKKKRWAANDRDKDKGK